VPPLVEGDPVEPVLERRGYLVEPVGPAHEFSWFHEDRAGSVHPMLDLPRYRTLAAIEAASLRKDTLA
jgi:hypothetical protein